MLSMIADDEPDHPEEDLPLQDMTVKSAGYGDLDSKTRSPRTLVIQDFSVENVTEL